VAETPKFSTSRSTICRGAAVGIPDPQTPIGAKGIGEPAICAVNAAIGNDFLRRTPATPSMIVASLDAGKRVDEGLVTHV
jgi:hypothetical protein